MFQPEDQISIKLSANEWNQIMGIMGKQPYEVVAGLIMKISGQAQMQMQAEGALPNGGVHGQVIEQGPTGA